MIAAEDIEAMPLAEKLQVMEMLWESLSNREEEMEVPQWHKDLLDEREILFQHGKAVSIDWEIAKQRIRAAVQ
jgi:hypothetical protein